VGEARDKRDKNEISLHTKHMYEKLKETNYLTYKYIYRWSKIV